MTQWISVFQYRGSGDFDEYPFDEPSPSPNYNPATPGYQPDTPQGPYTPQTPGAANMYNSDHTYSPYQQTPSPADYPSKVLKFNVKISFLTLSCIFSYVLFLCIKLVPQVLQLMLARLVHLAMLELLLPVGMDIVQWLLEHLLHQVQVIFMFMTVLLYCSGSLKIIIIIIYFVCFLLMCYHYLVTMI